MFQRFFLDKFGKGVATTAILLEYDALPDIGHGCGHNLIAEAGLAAAIGIKAAMEEDPCVIGKLVVLGTPAEESDGGKIKMLELGAFDDIDIALMVHPFYRTVLYPKFLSCIEGFVDFKGREAHAGSSPWNGINALDAAVACYQNVALLRQQIKPTSRISVIITKGGTAVNIIPADTSLRFLLRSATVSDLRSLLSQVKDCITSAAKATGCEAKYQFLEEDIYEHLLTNKVLMTLFEYNLRRLGFDWHERPSAVYSAGSTDMGNVSHRIPSIHPLYAIVTDDIVVHTKEFAEAAAADEAQEPTLKMGKAMALTALHIMRSPDTLSGVKKQLEMDLQELD